MDVGRMAGAEASALAAVAEAMRRGGNDAVAVEPLGGGRLVTLGPGRYVNRAVGVGPEIDDDALDVIDAFYAGRGLPPSIQLSSWAQSATLDRLAARGYRPEGFRSVFAAELPGAGPGPGPVPGDVEGVAVGAAELDAWLDVLVDGNEIDSPEGRAVSDEYGRAAHAAAGSRDFLALVGGEAAGCGSIQVVGGMALLGGAATRPVHRRRGVQAALLAHRFGLARQLGCDLVASTALPDGASARNLRRLGLQQVDTQVVLTASPPPPVTA